MEYLKDLGIVCLAIGGVSIVFKFLLNAFSEHLKRLEAGWEVQSGRMVDAWERVAKEVAELRHDIHVLQGIHNRLDGIEKRLTGGGI